jgi:hypothetical protein
MPLLNFPHTLLQGVLGLAARYLMSVQLPHSGSALNSVSAWALRFGILSCCLEAARSVNFLTKVKGWWVAALWFSVLVWYPPCSGWAAQSVFKYVPFTWCSLWPEHKRWSLLDPSCYGRETAGEHWGIWTERGFCATPWAHPPFVSKRHCLRHGIIWKLKKINVIIKLQ